MKRILVVVFQLFFASVVFAQNGATISGRVFDENTNQPLPFVTVTVNELLTVVNGAITDKEGRFVISGVSNGEYVVKFSFVGYQLKRNSFNCG